jgi:hypothetical protein
MKSPESIELTLDRLESVISELLLVVDQEGVLVHAGRRTLDLLRYEAKELAGKSFFDLLDIESRQFMDSTFRSTGNTPASITLITSEGAPYPVLYRGVLDLEEGHRLLLLQDRKEVDSLSRELLQFRDEAEAAVKTKSLFLANMSHELRTPLNTILGYTQLLEGGQAGEVNDLQKDYLSIIMEGGKHLLNIINDILDLARFDAGDISVIKKNFDLERMLHHLVATVRDLASERNIQLELDVEPGIGRIRADEARIKQVLYNLLANAIKFTENNRKVGLRARSEGNSVIIRVWDQGRGIPAHKTDSIFQPFEQIRVEDSVKNDGTGLGLAISRKLVELHNGLLSVESEPGKGSTFTVELPGRLPGSLNNREHQPEEETFSGEDNRKFTIMIVDDVEVNCRLVRSILDNNGYRSLSVSSGEEAIEKFRKESPDLILMDIQLTGMDGTEAMKQIRRESSRDLPILALTAHAMEGDREKFIIEGFDGYIPKPINVTTLMNNIHFFLEKAAVR